MLFLEWISLRENLSPPPPNPFTEKFWRIQASVSKRCDSVLNNSTSGMHAYIFCSMIWLFLKNSEAEYFGKQKQRSFGVY